jgi:adenylate cyclase
MSAKRPDWAAEGLLEGLDEHARRARVALLDQLTEQGVSVDELHRAVDEGRLAALPAMMLLGGPPRHSINDGARRTGLDPEFIMAVRRANGVPVLDPDAPLLSEADVAVGDIAKAALDSGVSEEQVIDTSRVMGHATRQIAEQMGAVLFELSYRPGIDENELAERIAHRLAQLQPLIAGVVEGSLRLHLREVVASAADNRPADGGAPGTREMAVAFADVVGFTRLGEELGVDELERVANRLSALVADVVNPPVRFVKTIGDAAMLVSPEPAALLVALLDLIDAADAEGEDFPQLRTGVTSGPVLTRGGDWFGRPVNLASRITALARAGSVLATRDVRDAAADAPVVWSDAGERRVRGVPDPVSLHRARRPEADGDLRAGSRRKKGAARRAGDTDRRS